MDIQISKKERLYLRRLAVKQAEYAALPVMQERKRMWYELNDARDSAHCPVIVETWTFDRDFLPPDVFGCSSEIGRNIETQLLRNVRNHEYIDDDKVIPDCFQYGWLLDIDEVGVAMPRETVKDSGGVDLGFRMKHPIKNLKEDLQLLRPPTCRVDRVGTETYRSFLDDLLGDILPPRLQTGIVGNTFLTYLAIELMGMEAYLMACYESSDEVHQLMSLLRDNALRVMRWAESEGLLRLNNGNQDSFGSSYNFTDTLPASGYAGPEARLCDMWGATNSQETLGMSPEMFHEFCFPYYRDVCEPLGLVYYGCCEPVHPFWEDIRKLPHLKKVSISRWCDQRFMGEALRGTGIVFSRKPNPGFLGVEAELDEDAWAEHIRESLDSAPGVPMEFIIRDVYTVHGNLDKPRRAAEIARREISRCRRN